MRVTGTRVPAENICLLAKLMLTSLATQKALGLADQGAGYISVVPFAGMINTVIRYVHVDNPKFQNLYLAHSNPDKNY